MIYDPYSREMQHDPYPTYRHFRDEEPCHYNPKMDFYALFRFEDVWEASLDWQGCAETTAKLIGNALVYLSREPSLRQRIRDEPQLIPHAIEELLRFDAPSQFQGRTAGRTLEMHGVTIPEGARVALVTGAACRDEREFDRPDTIDIDRPRNRQLYFGQGQHFCLGKSLARLETRIALEELRERFPNYAIDEDDLTRTYQAHVRGFATVPFRPKRRA